MGTVIVHPEPGFLKDVAQELLSLTANPYDVEYVMWPTPGFRIPEELLEMWESLTRPDPATGNDAPVGHPNLRALGEGRDEAVRVEPVKRKPGRPKKNTEGQ